MNNKINKLIFPDFSEIEINPPINSSITITIANDPYDFRFPQTKVELVKKSQTISVDVNYLKNVFELLDIEELKDELIQYSLIKDISILDDEIRIAYSDDKYYVYCKSIEIEMDDYIKLNEKILEKTMPKNKVNSNKILKF